MRLYVLLVFLYELIYWNMNASSWALHSGTGKGPADHCWSSCRSTGALKERWWRRSSEKKVREEEKIPVLKLNVSCCSVIHHPSCCLSPRFIRFLWTAELNHKGRVSTSQSIFFQKLWVMTERMRSKRLKWISSAAWLSSSLDRRYRTRISKGSSEQSDCTLMRRVRHLIKVLHEPSNSSIQTLGLKSEADDQVPKTAVPPLSSWGCRTESLLIDSHVKYMFTRLKRWS